jgi:membrane-bound serine protease (ClpP class)
MLSLPIKKFTAAILLAVGLALPASGRSADPVTVAQINIDGTIGPAAADYLARATRVAGESGAVCLIVQLNTPGGLLDSTQELVSSIYASPLPVVMFVAPTGANATSAGCFITLAANVAAMAPGTTIGAAHPVMSGGAQPGETMEEKIENFAVSYIEAIAEKRGRNVEWARSAVKESASITAERALELKVIDLIANDVPDLLEKLDGREVDGRALATAGAEVYKISMLARERVFQLLWRPEVMFILMLVAIYGILGELSNPGAILPGVLGAIALIIVLYMSAILPVNIAGIALIVLAVLLFVAEAFTPTFGLLTVGGMAAFLIGSLMLFDTFVPAFRLSLKVIIPATLFTAGFFVFIVSAGLRAQRLPARLGMNTLIGRKAEALTDIGPEDGRVWIEGEDWRATSATPIRKGESVEIVSTQGLSLTVKPIHPDKQP